MRNKGITSSKNIETELVSIDGLAKQFLKMKDKDKLPKAIHDELQNVFTKNPSVKVDFRKVVIKSESIASASGNQQHRIIKGKANVVYNALVLLYLIGTGETKKLLQHIHLTEQPAKRDLAILQQATDRQYLEFFCMGVVRNHIDEIVEQLRSDDFDVFSQKLRSPFSVNLDDRYDITPMGKLYKQDIPWQQYMARYQQAEDLFAAKKMLEAQQVLQDLEQSAVLRLPIIAALNRKIDQQIEEATAAWEYFQKILN